MRDRRSVSLVDAIHAKAFARLTCLRLPDVCGRDFEDPIGNENVYGTHHIGASTDQAQEAIAAETVRIIATLEAGQVPNVNLAARTGNPSVGSASRSAQVLAQVLTRSKPNRSTCRNGEHSFEGAEAAVARINLDKAPSGATLERLQSGNEDIIELNVLEIS